MDTGAAGVHLVFQKGSPRMLANQKNPEPSRLRKTLPKTVVWVGLGAIVLIVSSGPLSSRALFVRADTKVSSTAAIVRDSQGSVLIPGSPKNGVLSIIIPPGTAEQMSAGGRGYVLPSVIQLRRGDKIVIRNDDIFPHLMLYAFVMPGETAERVFDAVSTETYSAGCTIDPTPRGFTTLFVSE